jgi:hypothetical protein
MVKTLSTPFHLLAECFRPPIISLAIKCFSGDIVVENCLAEFIYVPGDVLVLVLELCDSIDIVDLLQQIFHRICKILVCRSGNES